MNPAIHKALKTFIAIVLGEAVLALLTTVAQEVFFDGISLTHSPLPELIIGGTLTVLAAVIAGVATSWVAGPKNWLPSLVISVLIIAESVYLVNSGKTIDPVWFDSLAAASLIAGIWAGYAIVETFRSHKQKEL